MAIHLPHVGPISLRRWLDFSHDIASLFLASAEELRVFGFNENQIGSIKNPNWRAAEEDAIWCKNHSTEIIPVIDERYPALLKENKDAPILLFAKGNIALLSDPQLAIVGSRNPTQTGLNMAFEFADYLSQGGLVITSGLALGIDTKSHQGALQNNGKTIAVFGTGFNTIYPAQNRNLAKRIMETGLCVTEFSPFVPPKPKNFPRRNRIISGLSLGVLVVEATLKSGSLITAQFALEQGREVFAIPGSIHNPLARGCHHLLRMGAKLVEKVTDIIEELGVLSTSFYSKYDKINKNNAKEVSLVAQKLLQYVGFEVTPVDVIILNSGLTASEVSSMLLSLESQRIIEHVQGGYVRIGHL